MPDTGGCLRQRSPTTSGLAVTKNLLTRHSPAPGIVTVMPETA